MLEKKPVKVVAVALANRMAQVVWALIRSGEIYRTNLGKTVSKDRIMRYAVR
ncbi:hypothetical protein [Roseovarius sp. D22-M7]|uniref:hypothetical protein n=1 Tax=Roseovarius sp. D22-M7 TaxID=3127116 RepID=UPI00300FA43F